MQRTPAVRSSRYAHLMLLLRRLLLALLVTLLSGPHFARPVLAQEGSVQIAAVAPLLSYQGRLLEPTNGQPKPDGAYSFTFRIYDVATGGTALWTETKSINVTNGLFTTLLGDTTTFPANLFNGQNLWLGITIASDPEATPRQRLAPVAYAMYADNADRLDGLDSSDFLRSNGGTVANSNNSAAIVTINQGGTHDGLLVTANPSANARNAIVGRAGSAGPNMFTIGGVFGTSSSGSGLVGSSNTGNGVLAFSSSGTGVNGQSNTGTGVNGQSNTGIGVRALSTSGTALQVDGTSVMNGNVTISSNLSVGGTLTNQHVAIGFAFINSNGTKASGSANVTSTWDATNKRYVITISGHSYFWTSFTTVVTPAGSCMGLPVTNSVSGNLLVSFRNLSNTDNIQCNFQFVTFRP